MDRHNRGRRTDIPKQTFRTFLNRLTVRYNYEVVETDGQTVEQIENRYKRTDGEIDNIRQTD